jgi:sugar lactone lactonase YvrE
MTFGAGETMQLFAVVPVDHVDGVGGEWTKKNARNHGISEGPLHGVAVDAKGQVYVADRGKERIVVFDAAGKQAGEIAVPHPHQIAVHPKTGDLYVLSRQAPATGSTWSASPSSRPARSPPATRSPSRRRPDRRWRWSRPSSRPPSIARGCPATS